MRSTLRSVPANRRYPVFPPPYNQEFNMKIRIGYELIYDCPQPTPMILTLNVH